MRLILLTDSRKGIPAFSAVSGSRAYSVEIRPRSELSKVPCRDDSLVYLDIAGLTLQAVRSRMAQLAKTAPGRFGIVDPADTLRDPAEVFQKGGIDYLGKRMLAAAVPTARFARVLAFASPMPAEPVGPAVAGPADLAPSGPDWSDVAYGREYTFQMLYVGIDHTREISRKASEPLLQSLRRAFQAMLEHAFAGVDGRIWVWKEYDGVMLFPFDGTRLTALIPAIRLSLNRVLVNLEQFAGTTPVSWRMGLHLGNTTYRAPGATGGIVSEALNFLFHLGERGLEPGALVVTGPALAFVPRRVREHLSPQREFESVPLAAFPRTL